MSPRTPSTTSPLSPSLKTSLSATAFGNASNGPANLKRSLPVFRSIPEYSEQALELPASSIRYLSQITLKSLIYETFVAEFADGSQLLLCVIGTPSGPKVDWDAYARYGNASWESILKGEVEGATVRVMPTPSTYYTGRFSDRDKWSAYALESPDIEIPVYGYLPKGSQLDKSLRNRVRAGAKCAVLSLKFTKETIYGRQAEITEIKTSGWVEK
ncbi:MAG: hypothetical protein ABF377_10525 [Akkermansiaceae bacterium]